MATRTAICTTCERQVRFKQKTETHLVTNENLAMWIEKKRQEEVLLGGINPTDDGYVEVAVVDITAPVEFEECQWAPCVNHRHHHGVPFRGKLKTALGAVLALFLMSAPAHALYNSKGSPATGSAGLDNWTNTYKGGWGYDTFNWTNATAYTNNTSIRYQGKTYGIEIEGGFNTSGTRNDKLAISWGEVGKKAGKGFLAGGAGAAVATADARIWALGALGGGLIGAFIGYLEELEAGHTLFHDGSHQSNTNCPCSTGGGGDTGSD